METATRTLQLVRAVNLALRSDRTMEGLYRTRFEGRPPRISGALGDVVLEYPRIGRGRLRSDRGVGDWQVFSVG